MNFIERPDDKAMCPKCGFIRIAFLPHTGSWSTPVCRCVNDNQELQNNPSPHLTEEHGK